MERINKELVGPTYALRFCVGSSIQDMLDGRNALVDTIYKEHEMWKSGLGVRGRLQHALHSVLFFLGSSSTFTYMVLPHKGKPYPYIRSAPRALVVLPTVTCMPKGDSSALEINDLTGSLKVEFPYGVTENTSKILGLKINSTTLKNNPWSSRIALFNVYDPDSYFLMHVFNDKVNEMAKDEVATWATKLALARA